VLAKYNSAVDVLLLEDINSAPRIWNHKVKVQVREKFNLRFPLLESYVYLWRYIWVVPKSFTRKRTSSPSHSMQTNSLLLDLRPIGGKVFTMLFTVIYTCMYRDTAVDRFNQIPDSIYFIKVLNATFFKKSGAQTCNVFELHLRPKTSC